jgi:hypothetical protein
MVIDGGALNSERGKRRQDCTAQAACYNWQVCSCRIEVRAF